MGMLKGALHVHSNVSLDSDLSLEEIRDLFKARGYSFVMTTEHAEDLDKEKYSSLISRCAKLSDKTFLMIPGIEVKWKDRVHLLAYGATDYISNRNEVSLEEMISYVRSNSGCDILVWGHFNSPENVNGSLRALAEQLDGVEVFNAAYHGWHAPIPQGLLFLRRAGEKGRRLIAFAGLDLHSKQNYDKIYCLLGETAPLSRDGIIRSIKEGQCSFHSAYFALTQREAGLVMLGASMLAHALRGFESLARRLFVFAAKDILRWKVSKS